MGNKQNIVVSITKTAAPVSQEEKRNKKNISFIKKFCKSLLANRFNYAKRIEAIAYTNWLSSLSKKGFPKNKNGTMMNCWELYNYWFTCPEKNTYIQHAIKYL